MALEAGDVPVPGRGLAARLAAVGGRARARGRARPRAERLCEPDILTAHGLRTLASSDPNFGPSNYHRGAVWPFDSWLGWGGLRACGRAREAERVRTGVLAALDELGRAPELYAVEPLARDPALQPRPGVDDRRPLGARARLGRPNG